MGGDDPKSDGAGASARDAPDRPEPFPPAGGPPLPTIDSLAGDCDEGATGATELSTTLLTLPVAADVAVTADCTTELTVLVTGAVLLTTELTVLVTGALVTAELTALVASFTGNALTVEAASWVALPVEEAT